MSLKLRKKTYHAIIYVEPGKQKWLSLGTDDIKRAKAEESRLKEYYKNKRSKKKIDIALGLIADPKTEIAIKEMWKKYISLKPNYSPSAKKIFDKFIKQLKTNIVFVSEIDTNIAFDYLTQNYKGSAPKTYNNVKGSLSAIWDTLAIFSVDNPWSKIPNKSGDSENKRPMTRDEIKTIIDNTTGFWHYATIIGYHTGLRRKDITFLQWDMIKFNSIKKIPEKTKRFKKAVYIPLHDEVLKKLEEIPKKGKYIFPDMISKYNTGCFNEAYPEILRNLKIKKSDKDNVGFHSLRVTFITECEEMGIERKVIQGIVGHSSPAMTELYSHDTKSSQIIKTRKGIL